MSIARLGHAALLTLPPTGIFRGCEPQVIHELSGVLETRQVAQFGHRSDCHSELDTAQGLEGLADAVARNYFKLLAYKDEYEVARLHTSPAFLQQVDAQPLARATPLEVVE